MKRYCVIGWPLAHTDSPKLHTAAFAQVGIEADYAAQSVPPEKLADFIEDFMAHFAGANVTIPHKIAVIEYVDGLSEAAKKIGAVNTIVNEKGKLVGHNTDWIGARDALEKVGGIELHGKNILILGAGGAARAVVYAMREAGAQVSIWNRTYERAQKLAAEFEVRPLQSISNENFDVIINTTSVGAAPNDSDAPLPNYGFPGSPAVMDIVYTPRMTRLLKEAQAAGCKIIMGDSMLKLQAQESFRLWTGKDVGFLKFEI